MARLTIRLPDDLDEWVEARADETGDSKAQVIRKAVRTAKDRTNDTRPLEERVDDLERRVRELENRGGDKPVTNGDNVTETGDDPVTTGDNAVTSGDGVTDSDLESALDELEIPGGTRQTRARREAIRFAWELLRDEGTAESREIANATFGAFFDDDDLGYSTSSRYPGYSLWDNFARDALRELPGVDGPGERGKKWRFDPDSLE